MSDKKESMLTVKKLDAAYGAVRALRNISLHVDQGEVVSLIGGNGAGKTTLLMTIFGNPRAAKGKILFEGEEITSLPTHKIAGRGIALVPEGRRIFPAMTVEENLVVGAISRKKEDFKPDLANIYKLFPRLEERQHQRAGTMSGGEQQMLAIGRSLMARPRLLLLDEPSLGLAPLIVKQIFEIIRKVADEGVTILLVEQNANQALKLADRGYVLMNGEIKLSGTGKELRQDANVRKIYLGEG